MRKVYMLRHQKAGVLTDIAFIEPPSDQQIAPLVAAAERLHGKQGWTRIHEVVLLEPGEIPALVATGSGDGSANGTGETAAKLFVGSGSGTVS